MVVYHFAKYNIFSKFTFNDDSTFLYLLEVTVTRMRRWSLCKSILGDKKLSCSLQELNVVEDVIDLSLELWLFRSYCVILLIINLKLLQLQSK